jgi:hypothetical protein
MSKSRTFRVMDTPTLIKINKTAVRLGQNRSLVDEFYDVLDPDGTHVVTFAMDHMNYQGVPGIRCQIYCKVKRSDEPVSIWIDVSHEEFRALPSINSDEIEEDIAVLRKAIG